jgi:hypothetical protein
VTKTVCVALQEKIICRLTQEGQSAANTLLLQDLPRKDKWWDQFMAGLRHPSVGMEDLADCLETEYDSYTGKY